MYGDNLAEPKEPGTKEELTASLGGRELRSWYYSRSVRLLFGCFEEEPEKKPPLQKPRWWRLVLQVRKMSPQGRHHLRVRNAPRGAGLRFRDREPPEKNHRRARSAPEEGNKGQLCSDLPPTAQPEA